MLKVIESYKTGCWIWTNHKFDTRQNPTENQIKIKCKSKLIMYPESPEKKPEGNNLTYIIFTFGGTVDGKFVYIINNFFFYEGYMKSNHTNVVFKFGLY